MKKGDIIVTTELMNSMDIIEISNYVPYNGKVTKRLKSCRKIFDRTVTIVSIMFNRNKE